MTDRHEPGTTAERIAHLEALRVQSEHLDPKAEERQRARGKGLARERIEALFDPGTFREIDRYAQHRNAELADRRPYGDGVITGHGLIHGRRVFAFMNNHFSAKAVANAAVLKSQLGQDLPGEYEPAMVEQYPDLRGLVRVRASSPRLI